MNPSHQFDAYAKPPSHIREVYKKYQKPSQALDSDPEIVDFKRGLTESQCNDIKVIGRIPKERLAETFNAFGRANYNRDSGSFGPSSIVSDASIYEHHQLPGLHILPSVLPAKTQLHLLTCLLHRDLSDPRHKNNIHAHYYVKYPPLDSITLEGSVASESHQPYHGYHSSHQNASFFSVFPNSTHLIEPKDPGVHKPMTISQFLKRKLRWVTLGGQYDWTNKVYPTEAPPEFPDDIAELLAGLFPDMKAQAAIVNLYTPGDTLSVHRDVSEDCDRGLVSISLGCDALFIVGIQVEQHARESVVKHIVLRLRSGDAVYMSGPARFAWHGVPLVIGGTCPDRLSAWPAESMPTAKTVGQDPQRYESWRDWMATKRINLNVRQMKG